MTPPVDPSAGRKVDPDALAAEFLAAYDAAALMPLVSSRDEHAFSVADAFAVGDRIRALRLARGERPLGYKIGFTNRGIWPRYGVHEPIWGPVWNTTTQQLDGVLADASLAGLSQPRLEPEIVFGFAATPRAGMNEHELTACLAWVAHGFEIVHTHFDGWRFMVADTVADFALHGRLFIGPHVPVGRFDKLGPELAALQVELLRDGEVQDRGVGSIVLDGPLNALRLWVDAMAAQPQRWPIVPGDVVTTGTITDAWPLLPGQAWQTRLSDARLSGLQLNTRP
jgi:2-oxo-3-hexenedioate decarboxylase